MWILSEDGKIMVNLCQVAYFEVGREDESWELVAWFCASDTAFPGTLTEAVVARGDLESVESAFDKVKNQLEVLPL